MTASYAGGYSQVDRIVVRSMLKFSIVCLPLILPQFKPWSARNYSIGKKLPFLWEHVCLVIIIDRGLT